MGYKTSFIFRAIVWLIAFAIVVWAMLAFGQHLGYFRDFYFKVGNVWAAITLAVLVFAIGGVLRYLLMLMWRLETGMMEKPKPRKRHYRRR